MSQNERDDLPPDHEDLPPEELNILTDGGDYGWPYCYGDRVPNPEYNDAARCARTIPPALAMQAHSAPLGLTFLNQATQLPADYRGDVLVAFHGSWNRSVPTGAKVVRVHVQNGKPVRVEDFITGWQQAERHALGSPGGRRRRERRERTRLRRQRWQHLPCDGAGRALIVRRAGSFGVMLLCACSAHDGKSKASPDSPSTALTASDSSTGEGQRYATSPDRCVAFPREDWTPANVGAATFVVNRATRGMAAHVRWALAPDSSAIIVVEDPAGVENEAVPDGVLYATERTGRTWRMDSVWSAAPSPDWTRVAVGRAVVLGGGKEQVVAPARWAGAAAALAAIAGPQEAITADWFGHIRIR